MNLMNVKRLRLTNKKFSYHKYYHNNIACIKYTRVFGIYYIVLHNYEPKVFSKTSGLMFANSGFC